MKKLGIILLIVALGACTKSQFCINPSPVQMRIVFKTYDSSGTKIDTPLVNADVYCTDTTVSIVENIESLLRVDVYPNRKRTQQTYVIFHSNQRDTLIINYTPEENFISNGCGYQTFFSLERVDFNKTNIDSVNITAVSVTDEIKQNLEVIFK